MGLFSARGRLPQPGGHDSAARLRAGDDTGHGVQWLRGFPARLGEGTRAGVRSAGRFVAVALRQLRMAGVAATNDARVVAVLLLLAAAALAVEMAASFHRI